MKVKDILKLLNERFIPSVKWKNDPSGLLIGDQNSDVSGIMLSLNPTVDVVNEAVDNNCNLIISHHPLFKKNVNKLVKNEYYSDIIMKMISNNVSFIACHTNFDLTYGGVSHLLAEELGLKNIKPLVPVSEINDVDMNELYKLVVYVPEENKEAVMGAISEAGGATIGLYDNCFFENSGIGRFRPNSGTDPFIGTIGKIEKVNEIKIETVVRSWHLNRVVEAVKKAHPYEEPVIDTFELKNSSGDLGLGVIGDLVKPIDIKTAVELIEEKLCTKTLRIAECGDKIINRIAVCGGSGSSFWKYALNNGADMYLSSEFNHHTYQEASYYLHLVDATHHSTEQFAVNGFLDYLNGVLNDVSVYRSELDLDPVKSTEETGKH